ncbi:unnamed protein product, partial [Allacma fusca]
FEVISMTRLDSVSSRWEMFLVENNFKEISEIYTTFIRRVCALGLYTTIRFLNNFSYRSLGLKPSLLETSRDFYGLPRP